LATAQATVPAQSAAEASVKTKHPDTGPEPAHFGGVLTVMAVVPPRQGPYDNPLAAELRLARLRTQVAILRTLADHIDDVARPRDADGLSSQLIEEMTRLGCRLIEAAASMTSLPCSDDSGVFAQIPAP
jgi:hypothetical protein